MPCLTAAQVIALRAFKQEHGRNWKAKLTDLWYNGKPIAPELQQVRNTLGPHWLYHDCSI